MTRSRPETGVTAFATFRVAGDRLVPDDVTRILKICPTTAYAKGERYSGGPRSQGLLGRTGVWYLSTNGVVASDKLSDHLDYIDRLLNSGHGSIGPFRQLQRLLQRDGSRAVVTCFWYGPMQAKRPTIPRWATATFKSLPAEIETDFTSEEAADQDAA